MIRRVVKGEQKGVVKEYLGKTPNPLGEGGLLFMENVKHIEK